MTRGKHQAQNAATRIQTMALGNWKHILYIWLTFSPRSKNTFEQTLPNHPYENVAPETQNGSLII